ncbi:hypothetical protein ACQ7NX_00685 [Enterobacter cloacae subsp. dissolvens]
MKLKLQTLKSIFRYCLMAIFALLANYLIPYWTTNFALKVVIVAVFVLAGAVLATYLSNDWREKS